MNLARHAAAVWRFRGVAASGLALGIVLAVMASYQVGWKSGPSFTPRGAEVWTSVSQIQVTQRGFPEGRTTLPTEDSGGTPPSTPKKVQFGDPGRLAYLADYYSKYLTSEVVLGRVPGKPSASQITASPFLAAAGGQGLPIIQLTANADSEVGAKQLNLGVFESLRAFMEQEQSTNAISTGNRVEVRLFVPPDVTLSSGRSKVMSVLVLVLCLVGTLALVHLLEALRGARGAVKRQRRLEAEDLDDADDMAVVMPWTTSTGPPPFDETQPERVTRAERVVVSAERATAKTAPGRRSAR